MNDLIDIIRNFEVTKDILDGYHIGYTHFSLTRTYLGIDITYHRDEFHRNEYNQLKLVIHHNKKLVRLNGEVVRVDYDLYDFLPITNSSCIEFYGNHRDREKTLNKFKVINREKNIDKILREEKV